MASAMERATPKNQEPRTKNQAPSPRTSGGQAQSVAREDDRWAWWLEVAPDDPDEVCAQPWANLGLADLEAAGLGRRHHTHGLHRCSPCDVTFRGDEPCWNCGNQPDDDWTARGGKPLPGVDSTVRRLDRPRVFGRVPPRRFAQ